VTQSGIELATFQIVPQCVVILRTVKYTNFAVTDRSYFSTLVNGNYLLTFA